MTWIQTYTGKHFYPLAPTPDMVDIEDIAHALANVCRFAGHTREFYSVAQHACMVSELVPPEDALAGLLHDAAEAYIADITRPLKPHLLNYAAIEKGIEAVIAASFGLAYPWPATVKSADMVALATERRDLMRLDSTPWSCLDGIEPLPRTIRPWTPARAKIEFLGCFTDLSL